MVYRAASVGRRPTSLRSHPCSPSHVEPLFVLCGLCCARLQSGPHTANQIEIGLELGNPSELGFLFADHMIKKPDQFRDPILQSSNILLCRRRLIAGRGSVIHLGAAVLKDRDSISACGGLSI